MKTIVKRLCAMAVMVCMVLSLCVTVSFARTEYHLLLEIKDTVNGFSIETKKEKISRGASLAQTVADAISEQTTQAQDDAYHAVYPEVGDYQVVTDESLHDDYGFFSFGSIEMRRKVLAGTKAYSNADDAVWEAWVDEFSVPVTENTSGAAIDIKALLKDKTAQIGELSSDTLYTLTYTPGLPDGHIASPMYPQYVDPAIDNSYVFTIFLDEETTGGGGGGGGGGSAPQYAITVEQSEFAMGMASAAKATKGDKITVTVMPYEGYLVDSITVKDANGNLITATPFGDGVTYTFIMPASAVSVTLTTSKKCPAEPFTDVDLSAWYHEALDYVLDNNLMSGYSDTTFGPNDSLSRAMVAQIFYNLEGQPTGDHANPFPDVDESKWYRNAISWAYANKVVAGYGDGLYRPEQDVTREELVQIFFNYAKAKGWNNGEQADLTTFVDYQDVAVWHEEAVSWGVSAKLLSGKGGNKIDPKVDSLRCEAAQMLMNLCINIRK